ncbi:hypothetical protein [Caviibacter abscessus]|uniref:hypothetical protein n=1 Tax=Caviibacter abscessus TaxID=1766719 RepID=UPI0008326B13|nr:hypothetical protein [Caviibacter abscessus]
MFWTIWTAYFLLVIFLIDDVAIIGSVIYSIKYGVDIGKPLLCMIPVYIFIIIKKIVISNLKKRKKKKAEKKVEKEHKEWLETRYKDNDYW